MKDSKLNYSNYYLIFMLSNIEKILEKPMHSQYKMVWQTLIISCYKRLWAILEKIQKRGGGGVEDMEFPGVN